MPSEVLVGTGLLAFLGVGITLFYNFLSDRSRRTAQLSEAQNIKIALIAELQINSDALNHDETDWRECLDRLADDSSFRPRLPKVILTPILDCHIPNIGKFGPNEAYALCDAYSMLLGTEDFRLDVIAAGKATIHVSRYKSMLEDYFLMQSDCAETCSKTAKTLGGLEN